MSPDHLAALRALIREQRIAALSVLESGGPSTALVAYAAEPESGSILLHLSDLSSHKRALLAHPECSLLVHEQDDGRPQPLLLQRATLRGTAALIPKDSPQYPSAMAAYLKKLPASRMMFALGDFDLLRIGIAEIRFVAGFGQAFAVPTSQLWAPDSESQE